MNQSQVSRQERKREIIMKYVNFLVLIKKWLYLLVFRKIKLTKMMNRSFSGDERKTRGIEQVNETIGILLEILFSKQTKHPT